MITFTLKTCIVLVTKVMSNEVNNYYDFLHVLLNLYNIHICDVKSLFAILNALIL